MNARPLLNRRILLTGATGTLGCETALALARMGAQLLLPVRNPAKSAALRDRIIKESPDASLRFLALELADETSVQQLANVLCTENEPLDAIIHNAGVFTKGGQVSPQGIEWHQQVNAISPFRLTQALLPLLQLAQTPAVVTVTSLSALWLKNIPCQEKASPTQLYAGSKKQLVIQMHQLSQQYPTIRFVYAHPGVCATGLFSGTTHQTAYNRHLLAIALPLMKRIFPSPKNACKTTLAALLQGQSGQLAEPEGFLHIWGEPKLVPLEKRITIL